MGVPALKRSLRIRSSAEAFRVLRDNGSAKIMNAALLKSAARSDAEPHPRVVREVHQALLHARETQPKEPTSPLKKISGIFSRRAAPEEPGVDEIVRRFEDAFVRED